MIFNTIISAQLSSMSTQNTGDSTLKFLHSGHRSVLSLFSCSPGRIKMDVVLVIMVWEMNVRKCYKQSYVFLFKFLVDQFSFPVEYVFG